MRDTISHFKLKLAEADEDTSCAALNRLRAKLRELMKDGQKADQQVPVVVERSMQTSVDLSESYENLQIENERLQAELMQMRRSIKEVAAPILKDSIAPPSKDEEEIDTSTLLSRLQNCEVLLAELKMHLDEKTAYAEALKSELEEQKASVALDMDQVTISRKDMDEVEIKKEEPNDKVSYFIYLCLQRYLMYAKSYKCPIHLARNSIYDNWTFVCRLQSYLAACGNLNWL